MKKLLTIAVPCYNVEWCLKKCLSSFVDERILDRLQVIVVNDGSTDGTSDIASLFIRKYPGTFFSLDKDNGGHGSTINAAIKEATGKYFKVIDADDWVITDNLASLLDILNDTEADVVVTNYHMVDMQTGALKEFRIAYTEPGRLYTLDEYMKFPGKALDCFTFHGLFFRTDCYRESGTILSEGIFYEDQEYATLPFCVAKTILPLDLFIYQYMVGNRNQSVADHNQVNRISHVEQVLDKLLEWYDHHPDMSRSAKQYFLRKSSDLLISYYVICLIKNPDRKAGRLETIRLREKSPEKYSKILVTTEWKYKIAVAMNCFHINSRQYEWLLNSPFYKIARRFIRKK